VRSDHQLARLLQIGMVLEEVVEARAHRHAEAAEADAETRRLLTDAAAESAEHRESLADLLVELDVGSVPYEEVEALVEEHYAADPDAVDGLLYDQLCNEETAYKFYDDLIDALEASEAEFTIDRERVLETLRSIRAEEADGVEAVTRLMERQE